LDVEIGTERTAPDDRKRGHVNAALAQAPLRAADRCDRCGAQAYVRVLLPDGGELLFCAHHGRKHADALRSRGAEIIDETDRLDVPSTAPAEER